jgi:proteic killer suppression protein
MCWAITSFRSKPLKRFWNRGDPAALRPEWRRKVQIMLNALDAASEPTQMNLPGFGFHTLNGDIAGRFALTVLRNWRITFGWDGHDAADIDLEDYHGT